MILLLAKISQALPNLWSNSTYYQKLCSVIIYPQPISCYLKQRNLFCKPSHFLLYRLSIIQMCNLAPIRHKSNFNAMTHIQDFSNTQIGFRADPVPKDPHKYGSQTSIPVAVEYSIHKRSLWLDKKHSDLQLGQITLTENPQKSKPKKGEQEKMDIENGQNVNERTHALYTKQNQKGVYFQNQTALSAQYTSADILANSNNTTANNQNQIRQIMIQQHPHNHTPTLPPTPPPPKHSTPATHASDNLSCSNYPEEDPQSLSPARQKSTQFQSKQPIPYHQLQPQPIKGSPTKKTEYTQPLRGLYYKNRPTLIKWMKVECTKLQLTRETYANAVYLLDRYYKSSEFNPNQFLCTALCLIILASKVNEKKVIYTQRMARNCGIEVDKMLQTQIMLLQHFRFRMDPYNYARILTEYMLRWDQIAINQNEPRLPLFLQQSKASFLNYQQIFFLCQNYLLQFRQLLTSNIKLLFAKLVAATCFGTEVIQLVENVFGQENVFARQQYEHIFECSSKSQKEHRYEVEQKLERWMDEFETVRDVLAAKFDKFQCSGKTYSEFINAQF